MYGHYIGNRSNRGLSSRNLDRAARIHEEQRRVILLIGLEGASCEEATRIIDVHIGTSARAGKVVARRSATTTKPMV
jgi:transposase